MGYGGFVPYWDVIFDRHKLVKNDSGITTLYLAYRYVLYEAKLLSSGGYAPRDHWKNMITIYVMASIAFNSYGLIISVQENRLLQNDPFKLAAEKNQQPRTSTSQETTPRQRGQGHVEVPPYPVSSLQPQVYPKHTVESVTELKPSVLTPSVGYVPYTQPAPVQYRSTIAYPPHPGVGYSRGTQEIFMARALPASLPSLPPHPLEQRRFLSFDRQTVPPAHPIGDPRYPSNCFGYNHNYSSAGESDPQRPHLYSFAAQHTPISTCANERPNQRGQVWEHPLKRTSNAPDRRVPPPL